MLGEIPSSVIDTYIHLSYTFMYIHAFGIQVKGIFHYVSARPAGIIYLVSNVSMFEQVSSSKKDCP